MGRKGIVTAAVAVLVIIAAGVGWYVLSPSMALAGLRDAAEAKDTEELAERIDFPAVRESVKAQLGALMAAEMAKQEDEGNPFAQMGSALALGFIGPMVDAMVTPAGMVTMLQQGHLQDPSNPVEESAAPAVAWEIERDGLDRFRMVSGSEGAGDRTELVFKRDGLGWKMIAIEMPKGGLAEQGT